jgi:hypothetical protein
VTAAVARYAARLDLNERFLLATPQRMMSSCMAATLAHWLEFGSTANAEEDFEDADIESSENDETSERPLISSLISAVRGITTVEALTASDTKYMELLRALHDLWVESSEEKVILFSSFKPTLRYLAARLKADGILS